MLVTVDASTLYIQFDEVVNRGVIVVTDSKGKEVVRKTVIDSNFETISLKQLQGKYRIDFESGKLHLKRTVRLGNRSENLKTH